MKVLTGYLLKQFFKLLLICEGIFLFLFLTVDFLQKIDNFIHAGARNETILLYFAYKVPYVAMSMLPPAALIAVIILFSSMKKQNEITALKASGCSMLALCRTILFAGCFLVAGTFLFSESIVPFTSSESNRIWNLDVEKRDPELFYGRNEIWYRGDDAIYWVRQFDAGEKIMLHPIFYFFDHTFTVLKRIEGRRGVWKEGVWQIEHGTLVQRTGDGSYHVKGFDIHPLDIPETPETFVRGVRKPEEMSYWQLKRFAEIVGREGYNNARYLVDMHIKIAFPFIVLVLIMIGIPLALSLKRGGTPLAVSLGMAACFLYLLTLGLSRSLGLSGVLPPLLSAWMANLIFSLAGTYMLMHAEHFN